MPKTKLDERDHDREDGLPSRGHSCPEPTESFPARKWGTKPGPGVGGKGRANETRGLPKIKTNMWEDF